MQALVRAALDLTTEHDRDRIFERMVGCAAEVAEARYAALALYDGSGHIERFVHHGLDPDVSHESERYRSVSACWAT